MTTSENVKRKSSLQHKLTHTVLGGVLAAFLVSFMIIIFLTQRNERKQEHSRLLNQVNFSASQIKGLQDSVYNMALQIMNDEAVMDLAFTREASTGSSLYYKRKAKYILGRYMHILDGIEEILIYNNDGRSISTREVRDEFRPEKNTWYMDFLKTGRAAGFSHMHLSEPISSNYSTDVISYIFQYYRYAEQPEPAGSIILSIEYRKICDLLQMNSPLIDGYVLYGSLQEVLASEGSTHRSYAQYLETARLAEREEAGDTMEVVSANMRDGWLLALEMSDNLLFRNALHTNAYLLLIFLVIFLGIFVILNRSIQKIATPLLKVTDMAQEVGKGNFDVSLDIHTGDEIEVLADVFNKMVVDIRQLMHESVEHEKVYRRMQIENLMLQINPHFIYNTMNSIVYIARMGGNEQIADFANAFIALLQSTLKVTDTIYNTVRDELSVVENYVYLQKYRYADKFTCQIRCPEELKDCQILNVTLQPLVENAIFHGIAPKEENGKIAIEVRRDGELLMIMVSDDGVGMTKETAQKVLVDERTVKHNGVRKIGLANVHKRIKEIYGNDYGMSIDSEVNVGTNVMVCLPYRI